MIWDYRFRGLELSVSSVGTCGPKPRNSIEAEVVSLLVAVETQRAVAKETAGERGWNLIECRL